MGANKTQVGGEHYKTGGLEHWDIVHMFKLDYFQGQITKYVMRHRGKNGIQDLKKAAHFLQKYIELLEAEGEGSEPAAQGYVNQDGAGAGLSGRPLGSLHTPRR